MGNSSHTPFRLPCRLAAGLLLAGLLAAPRSAWPQGAAPPVKVAFEDAQPEITEAFLPVDPTPRIAYALSPNMSYGLSYNGQRIT